jgi:hypothetical protein
MLLSPTAAAALRAVLARHPGRAVRIGRQGFS